MPKQKSVVVIGSRYGGGHKSAANNIIQQLKISYPKYQVHYMDFSEIIGNVVDYFFTTAYDTNIKHLPFLHKLGATIADSSEFIRLLSKIYSPIANYNLEKKIKLYAPDLIVTTFPAGNRLIESFKQKYGFQLVTMITDLTSIHSYWISNQADKYFVGTAEMIPHLQIHGIPRNKIVVTGFPIAPAFFANKSTKALRKKYNLKNKFTALYVIGSMPDKFSVELATELDQECQIVVATSHNTGLKKILDKKIKNGLVLGFTKDLDEYVRCSHVVIGKAGPGIIMESATLSKPVIITNYIAPQEYGNVELVLHSSWGYFEPTADLVISRVRQMQKMQSTKYKKLCTNAGKINPKKSTERICTNIRKILENK